MFISVLGIMFDIKDYAADHNRQLKTFVVHLGLRKTIFYILLPLCGIGLGTFLFYAFAHHFLLLRIVFNTIPFILLIFVAYSMSKRKSILYYLAVIDGLMLVKAICGSLGMILSGNF
jgi:4-hydroxybenzoate polyprenyltransferase